jgi:hypothetical protein
MKQATVGTILDFVIIIGALTVTGPISWSLMQREPVVQVLSVWFEPPEAHPGDTVRLMWSVRGLRDGCAGVAHPRLVDSTGRIFIYASRPTAPHTAGTVDNFAVPINIPLGAAPGPMTYMSDTYRWCNWPQELFWKMLEPKHPATINVLE